MGEKIIYKIEKLQSLNPGALSLFQKLGSLQKTVAESSNLHLNSIPCSLPFFDTTNVFRVWLPNKSSFT